MRYLVLFLALIATGCTTFSEKQCQSFQWDQVGYDGAMKGERAAEHFSYYQRHCGKEHNVQPSEEKFLSGYKKGVEKFCTPEYALAFGQYGGTYRGICPQKNEKAFMDNYRAGKLEYALEKNSQISGLESQVRSCQQ